MNNNRPIGVFDSGLGGLTVVKEIIKILPNEDIVYLGDTARVPYGTRSKETIERFSLEDADFLLKSNPKCIIIACHTASALASQAVKKHLSIPVIDAISPVIEKIKKENYKRIAVIGTSGTIGSRVYKKHISKIKPKMKIFEKACPLLVPVIEEGEVNGEILDVLINKYLKEIRNNELDALVLGCTHYPIIKKKIKKYLKKVVLIDPSEEIANKLSTVLDENKIRVKRGTKGRIEYNVTDLTDRFTKMAEMFMGEQLVGKIRKVVVD